ncbi:MAG: LPS export ABC transporter permease LptG [Gammaproteobacteria bacterium]|nr:LPS export ABC transporter permease LptG [Gammaproteobacteria bacterium]
MRIFDRYLGVTVIKSTGVVLVSLLSLFTLVAFVDELTRTGQGRYDIWQAAKYVTLMLPGLTYQLFPPAALLGCMVGLGGLASSGELTAMRAAGVSIMQITRAVLWVGLGMVVITVLIGEGLAPWAVRKAELLRTLAISGEANLSTQKGLWLRQGQSVIRIGRIEQNGRLGNVEIVELNHDGKVHAINKAVTAIHQGQNHWLLLEFERVRFTAQGATIERLAEHEWNGLLTASLLEVVTVRANAMPIWTLYQYIDYLEANNLAAQAYIASLWNKLLTPVTIAVMVLLAVPIVFGPLRSVGASARIFIGIMIGVGFYLINQVSGYVGLVFQVDPRMSAVLPTVVFALIAFMMMRRLR